jgi:PAS domain S-box-containing protein
MKNNKLTYQELEKKLAAAEKTILQLNEELSIAKKDSKTAVLERRDETETRIESEKNLRNLLDASSFGVAIYTENEEVIYANRALLDFCGFKTVDEFTPDSVEKFFTPESYQLYREREEKQHSGQPVPPEYEVVARRIDGEILHVRVILNDVIWNGRRQIMVTYVDITEQKQAENALKESEENFRNSLDTFPFGIIIYSKEEKLIYANQTVIDFLGFSTLEELKSITLEQYYTPESIAAYRERKERMLRGEKVPSHFELSIKRHDGEIRNEMVYRQDIVWGGQHHSMIIYQDITQQKKTEAALRESEEKYSKAFRSSPVMVTISTIDSGNIIETNDALVRRSGYSYEEIIGHSSTELKFWTKQDRDRMLKALQEKGRIQNEIFTFYDKSGEAGYVDFSAEPIEIGGKKCIITVLLEITERLKTEEKLRLQAQIMEQVQDIVIITDLKGNILSWNKGAERICGYMSEEVIGKHVSLLATTNRSGKLSGHPEISPLLGQRTHERDIEILTKSGIKKIVHISFSPIKDNRDNISMICGYGIDFTEHQQMENALKESEEKFAKAFRSSPEPIIITEIESGKVVDANEAVLRLTGFSYAEMIGHTVFELNLWVNTEERKKLQKIIREKGRVNSVRIQFRMKSGAIRTFNYSVEPIEINGIRCIITILSDLTEREKAEQALKASEQKLRSIVSIAPVGIAILVGTVVTEVNQRYCEMLGYSRDEIANRDGRGIYLIEEEYERVTRERNYQFISNDTATIETKFRRKEGKIIDVILNYKHVNPDDPSQGIIVTCMDITERKRMENELRESEEKFAKAFRSSPESVTITTFDENATFLEVNEAACKNTGYSYDELVGHGVYELGLWADPEDGKKMRRLLEEQGSVHAEIYKFRVKSGEIRTYEFSAEPIEIGGKKCIISIQSDITERIRAEETLKERNRTIRSIFSAAPIGIGMVSDDKIMEINEEYCNIIGYKRDELIGQPTRMVFPGDEEHGRAGDALFKQTTTKGYGVVETRFKHKNGSILDITMSCAALDNTDLAKGVVFTIMDITERKKSQEALKESEERFRNLFETMAQGVVYIDTRGKITLANPAGQQILGLTLKEIQGRTTVDKRWKSMHDDGTEFPGGEHPVMVALRTGRPVKDVVMGVFNPVDNDYRWIIIDAIPEFGKGEEKPYRVYALFRDITIRRQLEEKIRYQADLIQTVSDAIVSSDLNYDLISWNKAAEELYGWREEEVIGKNVMDLLKAELTTSLDDVRVSIDKKGFWKGESVHYTRDGRKLNILDSVSMKRDVYGNNIGAVSVFKDITERKQLEDSARYQASLIENILDPIISADTKYGILSWNRAAEELYGWKEEEVLGKNLLEVIKPVALNAAMSDVGASLTEKGYWNGEGVHRRRDGSEINVLESISVKRDTQGRNTGAVLVYKDITQRKRMEESLRYYADLVENVSEAIISVNSEKKLISWNKAAEKLFGWSREEVLGKTIMDFLPHHFLGVDGDYVDDTLNKYGKWSGESVHYRKDGKKVDTLESITQTRDDDGDVKESVIVFNDITESKKMAEALANESTSKRILIEQSRDGIVIIEQDGKVNEANHRFAEMLGYSSEEMLKLHVWDWDTQWPKEHLLEMINAVDEAGDHFETYHRRKDGTTFDVEISSNGAMFGGQKLVFCVCRDITERKKMEQALKESEERFSKAFHSSPDEVLITTLKDGIVIEVNDACIRRSGYTREDFIGHSMVDMPGGWVDPKERQHYISVLRKKGRVVDMEGKFHTKEGGVRTVLINGEIIQLGGKDYILSTGKDITERKQLEESIRYHASLVENVSDAIISSDLSFRILSWNKAAENIYGWKKDEVIGKRIIDILQPVYVNTNREEILGLLHENNYWRGEAVHQRKNGGQLNVLVSVSPLKDEHGQIKGAVTLSADITERKQAEEKHQTILKTALDGFHILDMKGNILEVNDSYCRMTGYTRDELLSMKIWDVEANKNTGPLEKIKNLSAKGYDRFETKHIAKDGRIIDFEVTLNYLNIGEGQVFSFLHDITARKRNEERINLLNMTLRSIRNVNQLITREKDRDKLVQGVCDALVESRSKIKSWIVLFGNSQYLFTYGASGTNKDFKSVAELFKQGKMPPCVTKALRRNKPVVTQSHDAACRGCVLAQDTSDYGSITVKLHYGSKTYGVLGVSAPSNIVADKDEIDLYEEVAMDIAFALYNIELEYEHEMMEQERLRAAKLESIGTLAGGIAHDFNNLLTGVLGNVGMAKFNIKPSDPSYEILDEAEKATVRARDLTQQLLTFARGGKPVTRLIDINTLIKETATFTLRGSQVKMALSLPRNIWRIEADEGQISQVIQNLIINAQEAMPGGGVLSISAVNTVIDKVKGLPLKSGNYVEIKVKDTGTGMSREQLQRVFEPYFTTKQRGSGLGLTSAFSIVRNHKGFLNAESVPGKGSTFHVYLPASKKILKGGKKMTAEIKGKAGGRILVMDDEPIIQRMLKQMLTLLGYEVVITADGAAAVDQFSTAFDGGNAFDVVIMDLTIPGGMGGKEAVKKLLEKDPAAKVIVSSGYATDPIMSEYKKYGFSAVVAKPYTINQLQETLSDLVKKKKK